MKVLILMQPILINNCRKFHIEILSNFGEIAIFEEVHFFIRTLYNCLYPDKFVLVISSLSVFMSYYLQFISFIYVMTYITRNKSNDYF